MSPPRGTQPSSLPPSPHVTLGPATTALSSACHCSWVKGRRPPSVQTDPSSLSKGSGAKRTWPMDGRLLQPEHTCPFVCFLTLSSAQDHEHPAKWTKPHSIHLFGAGLPLWKLNGIGATGPSEQRAQGARHPTVPRSQTPFLKEQERNLQSWPDHWLDGVLTCPFLIRADPHALREPLAACPAAQALLSAGRGLTGPDLSSAPSYF